MVTVVSSSSKKSSGGGGGSSQTQSLASASDLAVQSFPTPVQSFPSGSGSGGGGGSFTPAPIEDITQQSQASDSDLGIGVGDSSPASESDLTQQTIAPISSTASAGDLGITTSSFTTDQLINFGAGTGLLAQGATELDVAFQSRQESLGRSVVAGNLLPAKRFTEQQEQIRQNIGTPSSSSQGSSLGFLGFVLDERPSSERKFTGNILKDTGTLLDFTFIQPFRGFKSGIQEGASGIKGLETRGTISTSPLPLSTFVGGTSELIPDSPGEVGLLFGGLKALSLAPTVVRGGAGLTFGILGTAGAVNPLFTPEERVASGIVGVLGFAGAGSEALPFAQGGLARFSGRFRGIKTEQIRIGDTKFEAEFIKDIPSPRGGDPFDIGLIPEGVNLGFSAKDFPAGAGALARGGVARFTPKEQRAGFIGKELRLTTSQRGLKQTNGQFVPSKDVSDLGFFFTPADPITLTPQTRVSRLGADFIDPFKLPKSSEIDFTFRRQQPQIIVTDPIKIGTRQVLLAPKGSSELEVTSLSNIEILGRDVTTIQGRKVDIFKGRLSGKEITKDFPKGVGDIVSKDFLSTTPTKRFVSPSGLFGSSLGLKDFTSFSLPKSSRLISGLPKGSSSPLDFSRGFSGLDVSDLQSPLTPPLSPPLRPPRSPPPRDFTDLIFPPSSPPIRPVGDIFPPPPRRPPLKPIRGKPGFTKGGKKKKGKRKLRRTPGVRALNLGIFGKETVGEITGLKERPITSTKSIVKLLSG